MMTMFYYLEHFDNELKSEFVYRTLEIPNYYNESETYSIIETDNKYVILESSLY